MDVPQEEVSGQQSLRGKWPVQGLVEFHNVTMRYISTLPPALNHISFTIQGGMQVRRYMSMVATGLSFVV